ncbi:MAG: hypothetical protein ACN4E6_13530 [Qipengyuania pacifica]|jgi:hypothetical protein
MLKKMMAAVALAGAFMAVPAAAQDAAAAEEVHEYAAATTKIADGVDPTTGNVARQMLDLVAREARAKAMLEGSVERKKRHMSLNEIVKCHDCKQEKQDCGDQAKCDVRNDCQKAKCQKEA